MIDLQPALANPIQSARVLSSFGIFLLLALALATPEAVNAETTGGGFKGDEAAEHPQPDVLPGRIIKADIVALDQAITYNRFGSINPYAMIFALRRDVVEIPSSELTEVDSLGRCIPEKETPIGDRVEVVTAAKALAGNVRLRCSKRPRPLVLRANVGDRLVVRMTNLLRPKAADASSCDKLECRGPYPDFRPGGEDGEDGDAGDSGPDGNWPQTRLASLAIPGLRLVDGTNPRCTALEAVAPGETIECVYDLTRQGSFLFSSLGAPAGGEGDGGSAIQGLFGVVNVEPRHSRWYRSQVDQATFDSVWTPQQGVPGDPLRASASRPGQINYAMLDMLAPTGEPETYQLLHGDINAIVEECADEAVRPFCRVANSEPFDDLPVLTRSECDAQPGQCFPSYREFTVVFHDELKTFYAEPFRELETAEQLAGVGDGFAINYGASGMGTTLLANRKGLGPAKDCVECMYEEFFLQSWANGDPALLEGYRDDPSNVHHSYLNDRIVFRNLHVGKETHVFHLHAHQWESLPPGEAQGTYLDSQTIGPGQAFSYEIYRGDLRHFGSQENRHTGAAGNRNRTVGDSIFHCHLYPHFAQGMWALWRVHDVVEDGTRRLPDGQSDAALAYDWEEVGEGPRPGTDLDTGETGPGTPVPAVVPLPGQALPPLPTYGPEGMPGYPFYIAGAAGHRAPQPPNDFADRPGADGGLPRHVIEGGTRGMTHLDAAEISARFGAQPPAERGRNLMRRALALGDMTAELEKAEVRLIDPGGTPAERRAMEFHAGDAPQVRLANGSMQVMPSGGAPGYPSLLPDRNVAAMFAVNGSPGVRGAPYADPCKLGGRWDPANPDGKTRIYNVSAVQMDLVTNRDGWHDPQARINVLTSEVADFAGRTRAAEPFFFRAESGECIVFNHSNRTPKDLDLDDFQMATPTDTIGQHIHLVKFDVTSSDGSGNGWNYEDGTFAPDAVLERLCAAQAGSVIGGTLSIDAARCSAFHEAKTAAQRFEIAVGHHVQTTTQRWFADPLLGRSADGSRGDRTLGTVFTHDHFAPSSIQQHGFYSTLLVEPVGSEWLRPDGIAMPRERADSRAVGARALIIGADDRQMHPDFREFALAIADFALLYDPPCLPAFDATGPCATPLEGDVPNPAGDVDVAGFDREAGAELAEPGNRKGIDLLLHDIAAPSLSDVIFRNADDPEKDDVRRLTVRRNQVRSIGGVPIAPPQRPESISVDHHDPYLVNYRGEPIPLRVGKVTRTRGSPRPPERWLSCDELSRAEFPGFAPGNPVGAYSDVSHRRDSQPGALAYAFRSTGLIEATGHGDPCTPVLDAYEGERVGIRLVQGAQEVQHVFAIEGLGWPRLPYFTGGDFAALDNPRGIVGAQEVGISEHLEFEIPPVGGLTAGQEADFLMHFGSQDAIWNGAWGLFRVYNGLPTNERSPESDNVPPVPLYDGDGRAYITQGNLAEEEGGMMLAPEDAPRVEILALAATYGQIDPQARRYRDAAPVLTDPDALVLLPAREGETAQQVVDRHGAALPSAPPVWRINAGSLITLHVSNALSPELRDLQGDARLPPIVSINTDDPNNPSHDVGTDSVLSFTLPVLPQFPATQFGNYVGRNEHLTGPLPVRGTPSAASSIFRGRYYAGRVDLKPQTDRDGEVICGPIKNDRREPCHFEADGVPYAYGPLPLKPLGDVFGHLAHGLFGGVIIEPEGSRVYDPQTGSRLEHVSGSGGMFADGQPVSAIVCTAPGSSETAPVTSSLACAQGQGFREFVLFYQDGLNLHKPASNGGTVPVDRCVVCDDSYDLGEKGVSYRSEPFWARLNWAGGSLDAESNLNLESFPPDFFATSAGQIATPTFRAIEGEIIKFRVIQPGGRARQRSFQILGNDYPELLPFAVDANDEPTLRFGAPAAALLGPGKAITATLTCVRPGTYIYRDGPTHLFSGGVWGHFIVEPAGRELPAGDGRCLTAVEDQ